MSEQQLEHHVDVVQPQQSAKECQDYDHTLIEQTPIVIFVHDPCNAANESAVTLRNIPVTFSFTISSIACCVATT